MKTMAQEIHKLPDKGVFVIAGGGLGMLDNLLRTPGASNTVLEGIVPYSEESMNMFLGFKPEKSCSEETAKYLATEALYKAGFYDGSFGFAMTSTLTTTWKKKGDCRTHIAYIDENKTQTWNFIHNKGYDRKQQETMVSKYGLHCLYEVLTGEPSDYKTEIVYESDIKRLMDGAITHIWPKERSSVIMPGSFNPIHEGHILMKEHAEKLIGKKVLYELCINNIDKGMLTHDEIDRRMEQFDLDEIVVTNTPLFIDKALALGGNITFVVGIDTIIRLDKAKYYNNSYFKKQQVFEQLTELKTIFLVYGRHIDGIFRTLKDTNLNHDLWRLCTGIPEKEFRMDISSTELRSYTNI